MAENNLTIASEAEALAGELNNKRMTPLRTKQALAATIDAEQVVYKNAANTFTARQVFGKVNLGTGEALTIASGAITPTWSYCVVDTESAAASDDLTTISGGTVGDILILRAASNSRTVVVKNGTGNIFCGADITLDNVTDMVTLIRASSNWYMVASANNGA